MKKIIKILFSLALIIMITANVGGNFVYAEEDSYEPIVVVSSYKVSGDIIHPGEKFILTIELENTDKELEAKNILLNLSFSDGISTVYPTLTQTYLEKIDAGAKKVIEFEMRATSSYSRSTATFGVNIATDTRTNYTNLYAPVKLDTSLFKVVSKTIPVEANAGKKITVSFSFRSLLEEKLSNVILQLFVDEDENPVATTNIGNISAGASKSENMAFIINDIGEHFVKLVLSYTTSEGEESSAELYSGKLQINGVSEENNTSLELAETLDPPMNDRDKMIIIGCLGASLLLVIGIVIIAKKYN